MMKVLFSVLGVFVVCTEVRALKCYICDSEIHGRSCYDPLNMDDIKPLECKNAYSRQKSSDDVTEPGNQMFDFKLPERQRWDPSWSGYPTDFECVQYEKTFTRINKRQFVRKCLPKNENPDFCNELQRIGNYQGYTLTKCNVCYGDYCNSSGNVKLSLFLNLVFFYIFYQSTSF